jgi:hypothetical protein
VTCLQRKDRHLAVGLAEFSQQNFVHLTGLEIPSKKQVCIFCPKKHTHMGDSHPENRKHVQMSAEERKAPGSGSPCVFPTKLSVSYWAGLSAPKNVSWGPSFQKRPDRWGQAPKKMRLFPAISTRPSSKAQTAGSKASVKQHCAALEACFGHAVVQQVFHGPTRA